MSMRRWVSHGVLGLIIVALMGVAAVGVVLIRRPPLDEAVLVGETVRVVKDGYVAVGLIMLRDGTVALVDCGMDETGRAIRDGLKARGMGTDAVKAILLTHGHPDHVAACGLYSSATVYALQEEHALLLGNETSTGPLTRYRDPYRRIQGTPHTVRDGEELVLGGTRIEVFGLPGHTAGSAAFLVDGVLFMGDSAESTRDGALRSAPWMFTDDVEQNARSLQALAARLDAQDAAVRAVVFSHTRALLSIQPLRDWARGK